MGGLRRLLWHRVSAQAKSQRHFHTLNSPRRHLDMNPTEDGLPIPQRYWAILTLMVGVALSCLDTALVNVAAADRQGPQFQPGGSDLGGQRIPARGDDLAAAAGIVRRHLGYRRVYRFGLVLYTGAALISALAGSVEILTLGRALQGLGAAGIMSVNTALIRYTYPRRQLGRGIALTSLVVSTSSAAGPTVASAILWVTSWPWLFAVNVPIGIVTLVLSMRLLPHTEPSGHRFDLWSAVLCALMFGSRYAASTVSPRSGGTRCRRRVHRRRGRRVCAVAASGSAGHAVAADRLVPSTDLFGVGDDLGAVFHRPRPRLRLAAVLFPGRDRGVGGGHRAADDAVAGDQRADGAVRRPARRPLSGRHSRQHRPRHSRRWLRAARRAPSTSRHRRHIVADCRVRRRHGAFHQPNARAIVMAAPRERSGGAGAIQGSARLLGQSIGAAMVALVFGVSLGGRGALTALVLAACFAAVATVVSLTRQFDFVRAGRLEHEPGVTEPADAPGPAA